MRLKLMLLACLALGGPLAASGGSPEAWLGGTQPWDTTPMKELDLELRGAGGDGAPGAGVAAQWGVVDTLQVAADWEQPLKGGDGLGELRAQWRETEFPDWRPALALLGRASYASGVWEPRGGLLAAWEPFDSSLTVNATAGGSQPWLLRAGFWTPYVATMLRLGVEAAWSGGVYGSVCPQLLINAPGDLSLSLGVRLDALEGVAPRYLVRLSYQLFPSP